MKATLLCSVSQHIREALRKAYDVVTPTLPVGISTSSACPTSSPSPSKPVTTTASSPPALWASMIDALGTATRLATSTRPSGAHRCDCRAGDTAPPKQHI
eukprot:4938537-Pyramimonas_sp.AAC.1